MASTGKYNFKCPFCEGDRVIGVKTQTDNYFYCYTCRKRWEREDVVNTRSDTDTREAKETA